LNTPADWVISRKESVMLIDDCLSLFQQVILGMFNRIHGRVSNPHPTQCTSFTLQVTPFSRSPGDGAVQTPFWQNPCHIWIRFEGTR
jgi:hypothetical protein